MSLGGGVGGGGGADSAALRQAAASGDTASCSRILGSARSVRFSRDELGRSALHLSASAGHTSVVRLLLGVAAPREVSRALSRNTQFAFSWTCTHTRYHKSRAFPNTSQCLL